MLTEKEIKEIRFYLERAENPLFFYDDDVDGLCSYMLLRKRYDKGYGIAVKSAPQLDMGFLRKVDEYSPDLVVVLDKPIIAQDFIDSVNVPLLWIDHHPIVKRKGVHYYNPKVRNPDDTTPTTGLCFQITDGSIWIGVAGCVADWYIPYFFDKGCKEYPDLIPKTKNIGKLLFESNLGKLIKIMSFLLKGRISEVRASVNTLLRLESPYELLEGESARGRYLLKRIAKFEKEYNSLLSEAKESLDVNDKILLFVYPSTKNSYTAELSNELSYLYPSKLVIVGREKGDEIKMSFRSTKWKLPKILDKALRNVKGYGGGHDYACGGCVSKKDFSMFIENLRG